MTTKLSFTTFFCMKKNQPRYETKHFETPLIFEDEQNYVAKEYLGTDIHYVVNGELKTIRLGFSEILFDLLKKYNPSPLDYDLKFQIDKERQLTEKQ